MEKIRILWADDEIDLLKPHLMFLNEKGYEVETVTNGTDAIDQLKKGPFDIIFLDENMPGLSGVDTFNEIRGLDRTTPVVMITKSEEEHTMEEAIGSRISDYLIKPVKPNQILLTIKKHLDDERLVTEKSTSDYQKAFSEISARIDQGLDPEGWQAVYRELVHWSMELEHSGEQGMEDILDHQREEADQMFARFISEHYEDWIRGKDPDSPLLSQNLFKEKIAPHLNGSPLFLVVIDNLRYDQWKALEPMISRYFRVEEETLYYSILPTATQYARNALFAGLMPATIKARFPDQWIEENESGSKNQYEADFLKSQLSRLGKDLPFTYNKITNLEAGKKLADDIHNLMEHPLNVIVHNFVDILSHARSDIKVVKELMDNEAAYRSATRSWFEHSPLFEILREVSEQGGHLILTTDHGSIPVDEPSKVVGDRETTTNLRYKEGRNLSYNKKDVMAVSDPDAIQLPRLHMNSTYIFSKGRKFLVYPNNYNKYVRSYQNTFQHGGISMEEMLVPLVRMSPR